MSETDIDPQAQYPVTGAELLKLRTLARSVQHQRSDAMFRRVCDWAFGAIVGLCIAALIA